MWSADGAEPGKVAGEEVVHLYIRDKESSVTQPVKELKGFRRVTLAPGEKQTISFTLTPRSLSLWNIDMKRVVEPAAFDIMVGPVYRSLKTVPLEVALGCGCCSLPRRSPPHRCRRRDAIGEN